MNIYSNFKYRVQIVANTAEGKLIKGRKCFLRIETARSYFDSLKVQVIKGEKLFLDSRDNKEHEFKELESYEVD